MSKRTAKAGPRVLSAFTGAGGSDLGLEAAGYRTVGCIEVDPDARNTIRTNRPAWNLLEPADVTKLVRTLEPSDVGLGKRELDVLVGGPPCQPFSNAAQWAASAKAGMKDQRSDCIRSFFGLVKIFLPKVVLLENVEGFVLGKTSVLRYIKSSITHIEREFGTQYRLHWKIIDACDYGVPQRRRRALVVLLRNHRGGFVWPLPTHLSRPVRAWDALAGVPNGMATETKGKWAPLLASVPEGQNYLFHTDRGAGLPLFGYRTRYWSFLLKLAKDQPSWTLPAQPGPSTGPFHWENRPLTVDELLRLQTFPASWEVVGTHRSQVRQVGNATPPLLAEVIGRAIGEQIFGLKYGKQKRFWVRRKRMMQTAEPTQRVPSQFMYMVGKHPPHPGSGLGPNPMTRREK